MWKWRVGVPGGCAGRGHIWLGQSTSERALRWWAARCFLCICLFCGWVRKKISGGGKGTLDPLHPFSDMGKCKHWRRTCTNQLPQAACGANFRVKKRSESTAGERSNIKDDCLLNQSGSGAPPCPHATFLSLFEAQAELLCELWHRKLTVSEKCLSRLNKYNTSAAISVIICRQNVADRVKVASVLRERETDGHEWM